MAYFWGSAMPPVPEVAPQSPLKFCDPYLSLPYRLT